MITALASAAVIGVFAIPVIGYSVFSRSDALVTAASNWWARVILAVAGVRLTVEGREHVPHDAPRFFVGNHQGTLDIPILIVALGGRVRFMAKRALFRIPVFGWMLSRGRYVPIDRRDARRTYRTLETMLDELHARPISFAVFPEGQRTQGGRLQAFRPGSLKVCQRSGFDIVPFTIDGSHRAYDYRTFRATPARVRLVFSKPIPATEAARMSVRELCDTVRAAVAAPLGAAVCSVETEPAGSTGVPSRDDGSRGEPGPHEDSLPHERGSGAVQSSTPSLGGGKASACAETTA